MLNYSLNLKSCFAARKYTSAQSVPNATATDVIFNNRLYDTHNQYNSTTGIFTCQIPGFWCFTTAVRVAATTQNMNLALLQIIKNSLIIRGQEYQNINAAIAAMTQTYCTLLNIGETVKIQVFASTTGGAPTSIEIVDNSFELAHFSGFKVD